MIRTRPNWAVVAVVLTALLLQSFASAQSVVMMAAGSVSDDAGSICAAHIDQGAAESLKLLEVIADKVSAAGAHDHHSDVPHRHEAACPFCAAACHVPIIEHAAPLLHPVVAAFVAFRVGASRSPRGCPPCEFRARGPPAQPLTA